MIDMEIDQLPVIYNKYLPSQATNVLISEITKQLLWHPFPTPRRYVSTSMQVVK